MIIKNTLLNVADNSGARVAKCIHVFNNKKYGVIGDLILVSIKIYNPQKKIKKGEIHLAFIIRTKSFVNLNNKYINFSDNAIVLLNRKFLPLGTRLFGSSLHSIRFKNKKVFLMLQYIL